MNELERIEQYQIENRLRPHKREPAEYCNVIVVNGYFAPGMFGDQAAKKWYWMLEGETLFCLIIRGNDGSIRDLAPCHLTGTKINYGRTVAPEDCVMI